MPVELSHLMQLAMGRKPTLPVGDLPRPIAERFGCHPAIVFLRREEFFKIAEKHPEIRHAEFQVLPYMIKDGRYYDDSKRPNCFTVFYEGLHNRQLYLAGLKVADHGHEVWVSTFHRTNPAQESRYERRHNRLR